MTFNPIPSTKEIGIDDLVEPNEYIEFNQKTINPEVPFTVINNSFGPLTVDLGGPKYNISKNITCTGPFRTTMRTIGETYTLDNTNTPADFIYDNETSLWNSSTVRAWPRIVKDADIIGVNAIGAIQSGLPTVLSADGQFLAIGAPGNFGRRGSIWLYRVNNEGGLLISLSQIAQFTPIITPILPTPVVNFLSIALSSDSSVIVVGLSVYNIVAIYTKTNTDIVSFRTFLTLPPDSIGATNFGISVAVSSNGNIIVIGAGSDNANIGATWVFRSTDGNNSWAREVKLVATGAIGASLQGNTVAISPDGNLLFIGGPGDNASLGAVWVFLNQGINVWQQQAKIVPTGAIGPAIFGGSINISQNENILAVGGTGDNANIGAVWIFRQNSTNGSIWIQETKLIPSDATAAAEVGPLSLAPSGDIIAIGAGQDNAGIGATWIFARNNNTFTWTQVTNKLLPIDGVGTSNFGLSLALDPSGQITYIGGPGDNTTSGANWIFTNQASSIWQQAGLKIIPADAIGGTQQGSSVCLDATGFTLVSGGPADNVRGAVWVFERDYSYDWIQAAKLLGQNTTIGANFGRSTSIDKSGRIIVVGGPGDNANAGAIWIFYKRDSGEWIQLGQKITPADNIGPSQFGTFVSINLDGSYIAVGGPADNTNVGAVWVYIRSGSGENSTWAQQAKIIGSGATGAAQQGRSVSISSAGDYLAFGGPENNAGVGAVWIWLRTGAVWAQQQRITVADNIGGARVGSSVSINAPGNIVAFGGENDNGNIGAVWVWTRTGAIWTQQTKIVVPDSIGAAPTVGNSISINAEGSILAFGGQTDNTTRGAVWVYTRNISTWLYREKFTSNVLNSRFGRSVNITYRGSNLVVGSGLSEGNVGGVSSIG